MCDICNIWSFFPLCVCACLLLERSSANLFLTQTVRKIVPHWTRRALCNPAGRSMVRSALQDFRSQLRSYHSRGEFPEAQQWNRKPATAYFFSHRLTLESKLKSASASNNPLKCFMLLWDWRFYGFYWEPLFYNNAVNEMGHKTINTDRLRHLADVFFYSLLGEFTKKDMHLKFMLVFM